MYRQIHYRIYSTSYSTTSQYRMLASQLVVLCSIQIPTVVQVGIPTTAVLVQCRSSYYRYQQCYYCTATPTVARSRSSQQLYWYNVDLATIDSSSATTVLLHLLQLDLDLASTTVRVVVVASQLDLVRQLVPTSQVQLYEQWGSVATSTTSMNSSTVATIVASQIQLVATVLYDSQYDVQYY